MNSKNERVEHSGNTGSLFISIESECDKETHNVMWSPIQITVWSLVDKVGVEVFLPEIQFKDGKTDNKTHLRLSDVNAKRIRDFLNYIYPPDQ